MNNITCAEEFDLMNDWMSGNDHRYAKLLIDRFECKELKSSLENTPVYKDNKGNIKKDKKGDKLPVLRLPMESTNLSDAFKYLLCRKQYLNISKSKRSLSIGDVRVRG